MPQCYVLFPFTYRIPNSIWGISIYLWKFCALHCSCLCCGDRQCAFSFSGSEVHLSVLILIKLLTLPCHVTVLSSRADPTCRLVRTPEGQGIQ